MFRSFVKAAKGIYIHHELYIAEKKNKSINVNVYKEYVLYRNGEWFIIEINPRSVSYTHLMQMKHAKGSIQRWNFCLFPIISCKVW